MSLPNQAQQPAKPDLIYSDTDSFDSTISRAANRLVLWIARHWLALFNSAWGMYLFLPILAPILMYAGWETPARLIYGIYSFACHQLPDHSYFLFGPHPAPLAPDLASAGLPAGLDLFQQRKFIGSAEFGYKVALCQRDVAIYGSVLFFGLLFSFVRTRLPALSIKTYLLFLIPIAIDGTTQLFGLRESNWWLRTITGILFGMASVWLAYPYIEDAMQDVVETEVQRNRTGSAL